MAKLYMYVVARDFGFAPNPFHGVCTLATCKPKIRRVAKEHDWIVGMGGGKLKATGRCIYVMQVTGSLTFEEYWESPDFRAKRPARNGSRKVIVGDNIYHKERGSDQWLQEDSHHSKPDGSPDQWNVEHDTGTDRVLFSAKFMYFGNNAPVVPKEILNEIGYRNVRDHRTFHLSQCEPLIAWIKSQPASQWNMVLGDPFQFADNAARYSKEKDRIIT